MRKRKNMKNVVLSLVVLLMFVGCDEEGYGYYPELDNLKFICPLDLGLDGITDETELYESNADCVENCVTEEGYNAYCYDESQI